LLFIKFNFLYGILKIYYLLHKNLPIQIQMTARRKSHGVAKLNFLSLKKNSNLIQTNPAHTHPSILFIQTPLLSYRLLIGLRGELFPLGHPIKIMHAVLISPMHSICSAHLYFITLITFGEEHKL
jgi:hypothetical protein